MEVGGEGARGAPGGALWPAKRGRGGGARGRAEAERAGRDRVWRRGRPGRRWAARRGDGDGRAGAGRGGRGRSGAQGRPAAAGPWRGEEEVDRIHPPRELRRRAEGRCDEDLARQSGAGWRRLGWRREEAEALDRELHVQLAIHGAARSSREEEGSGACRCWGKPRAGACARAGEAHRPWRPVLACSSAGCCCLQRWGAARRGSGHAWGAWRWSGRSRARPRRRSGDGGWRPPCRCSGVAARRARLGQVLQLLVEALSYLAFLRSSSAFGLAGRGGRHALLWRVIEAVRLQAVVRWAVAGGALPWRWCPIQNTDRVLIKLKSMKCPSWIAAGCYKKDTTSAEIFIRSIVHETISIRSIVHETSNVAAKFAGERSVDFAGGRRSSAEHSNVACYGYTRETTCTQGVCFLLQRQLVHMKVLLIPRCNGFVGVLRWSATGLWRNWLITFDSRVVSGKS